VGRVKAHGIREGPLGERGPKIFKSFSKLPKKKKQPKQGKGRRLHKKRIAARNGIVHQEEERVEPAEVAEKEKGYRH